MFFSCFAVAISVILAAGMGLYITKRMCSIFFCSFCLLILCVVADFFRFGFAGENKGSVIDRLEEAGDSMASEMVKAATSDKLKEMDWAKNIEICELVARDPGYACRSLLCSLLPSRFFSIRNN